MDADKLDELERLLKAATPAGDWSVDENTIWSNDRGVPVAESRIGAPTWYRGPKLPYAANAALIVAAINALPELVAMGRRVERLESLVRTMIENEPGELVADGGHTVLDLWRHEARAALKGPTT